MAWDVNIMGLAIDTARAWMLAKVLRLDKQYIGTLHGQQGLAYSADEKEERSF